MSEKIMLIDGHSLMNRAFYGLPNLTNAQGIHTNAILGFLNIVLKYVEEEQPTHLLVAFDRKEPTFRHLRYESYKGTRKPMPEELREQIPLIKEVLGTMEIPVVTQAGIEADDILGTIGHESEQAGFDVVIVSGDRDLLQLATSKVKIKIPKTKSGKTITEDYYEEQVQDLYGVTPIEFIDMKGLMGDPSDNIPGVPGIGEKTAAKIIKEFHSIEEAYEHIEKVKPAKAKNNLQEYYDQAILSKELATIKVDCTLDYEFHEAKIGTLFNKDAYKMFRKLELKSLFKYFEEDQKEDLTVKTRVITEFAEADQMICRTIAEGQAGMSILGKKGSCAGLALALSDEVVIIKVFGFVTEEYIRSEILHMLQESVNFYVLDYKALLHFENRVYSYEKQIEDLSLMAYLINPLQNAYDYDDISRDYLETMLPSRKELLEKKDLSKALEDGLESAYQVAGFLAKVPLRAYKKLKAQLQELDMQTLYDDIEKPLVYSLYCMEHYGIKVEKDSLKEYGDQLVGRITELEKNIYQEAGHVFNINSPKQLGIILFEEMKMPYAKKTKTGYSTSADILEKLAPEYPFVSDILEYRQLTKLKSTYADGLAAFIQEDGRIHGVFHQKVTATGRLSSSDPNLQNIPIRMPLGRAIRKVFIPEEGYVFVSADYSQIELRVLASMAEDENLIKAYQEEKDIHTTTASQVFGVSMEDVTPLLRRNAKAVNFGIVYGISSFGLSEDLHISRKEAKEYIDKYFRTYPQIKKYLDENVEYAKQNGYVKTLFGRIRPIPELSSANFMQRNFGERVAMNSSIQGTAADIIKIAMIRVSKRLEEEQLKSRLILQIHDELLIETAKDEVDKIKQILKEEMMGAADLEVPLNIDIEQGTTWYEAK